MHNSVSLLEKKLRIIKKFAVFYLDFIVLDEMTVEILKRNVKNVRNNDECLVLFVSVYNKIHLRGFCFRKKLCGS